LSSCELWISQGINVDVVDGDVAVVVSVVVVVGVVVVVVVGELDFCLAKDPTEQIDLSLVLKYK
jgi:hypothetical protein